VKDAFSAAMRPGFTVCKHFTMGSQLQPEAISSPVELLALRLRGSRSTDILARWF